MRLLLTALHGILTGQTDPSWPDRLDAWMFERDANVKVLKKEYRAGPFPRWNCWVKDRLLARSLANEIELFFTESARDGFQSPCIWLVAHSNGAVIALLTAGILIERGHRIAGLILTGGACEADIDRNGVLEWQCRGMLGAAIAYCSKDDKLLNTDSTGKQGSDSLLARILRRLWGKAIWPYGCLGRSGWLFKGRPLASSFEDLSKSGSQRLLTRWFSGGHSTYFKPQNVTVTFEQIYRDLA